MPEAYFVFRSPTFGNWYLSRGFLVDGEPKGRVDIIKKHTRIYRKRCVDYTGGMG
jgi:hypothetical protein